MSGLAQRLKYEQRIFLLGLTAGLAGSVTSFVLLWSSDYATRTRLTLTLLIVLAWVVSP